MKNLKPLHWFKAHLAEIIQLNHLLCKRWMNQWQTGDSGPALMASAGTVCCFCCPVAVWTPLSKRDHFVLTRPLNRISCQGVCPVLEELCSRSGLGSQCRIFYTNLYAAVLRLCQVGEVTASTHFDWFLVISFIYFPLRKLKGTTHEVLQGLSLYSHETTLVVCSFLTPHTARFI